VNTRDLERYKRLLLVKLEELSAARSSSRSPVIRAGVVQGDLIEQANAEADAELEIQLRKTDGPLVRAVDDALARLRARTFGICEICKHPISKARLEAVPWTRACRECKEREQSAA
jgi:DnaK suppressor protein